MSFSAPRVPSFALLICNGWPPCVSAAPRAATIVCTGAHVAQIIEGADAATKIAPKLFAQDYQNDVQICLARFADDPVCAVVRKLIQDFQM